MDKNEWSRVGEEIKDQVQASIDSGDFSQLGRSISDSVNRAMKEMRSDIGNSVNRAVQDVANSISDAVEDRNSYSPYRRTTYRECRNRKQNQEMPYTGTVEPCEDRKKRTSSWYQTNPYEQGKGQNSWYQTNPHKQEKGQNGWYQTNPQERRNEKKGRNQANPYEQRNEQKSALYKKQKMELDSRYFDRRPKGSVSGVLYTVFGYVVVGGGMIATLLALAGGALSFYGIIVCAGVILAAGIGMGARGTMLRGRVKRYRRYVELVKEKLYCSLEELSAKTGRDIKYIRKDLKKMIRHGMFRQAHLDSKETCLIVSDEVYEQYQITQKNYEEEQRKKEEENRTDMADNRGDEELSEEVRKVIEEGQNYVRLIRQCNDDIPGEEMSDKLDRLEEVVTRIFEQVRKEPEQGAEMRKLISYYLPTTQKLLETYRDLDQQQIEGGNISQTKKDIEAAVDTINGAFERFLDELFRDKAWDIQSDISVLNTMLKQDGYLEKDF